MTDTQAPETQADPGSDAIRDRLLDAALLHVAFDGWSEASFRAAIADTGMSPALARAIFPRGGVDMAVAFHKRGDAEMMARLAQVDLGGYRVRDRVVLAVRRRIEAVSDRELVRRGTTLFALPQYAAEGARLIWGTADAIWRGLGDTSQDVNWYTKRATLSAVYGSTVLFWLGDDSPGNLATWDFLGRRIDNVMAFEKAKAQMRDNPMVKVMMAGPNWLMGQVRAPRCAADLPGSVGAAGPGHPGA